MQITAQTITLQNESGMVEIPNRGVHAHVGDILEAHGEHVKVLTTQTELHSKFTERILSPRRRKAMKARTAVERGIRDYFDLRGFIEVRTPILVKSPGMEAHIDPFELRSGQFLPSSPEFAMKKILAGGLEKIYQICSAFRDEPVSHLHRPEFTMLEFYRAFSNDEKIQEDIENLVAQLAQKISGNTQIRYGEKQIDLTTPWPRLKINDLFIKHLNIDLKNEDTVDKLRLRAHEAGVLTAPDDTWDEIYFRLWIERIEEKLPANRAVFVTHYPPSQAALARLGPDGWARRFEAFIGGIELCNGYDELTDAKEQRARFHSEINLRKKSSPGKSVSPIDEEFLAAIEEGLPPSGGVALGVDRLVMLLADENDIDFCFWI